MICTVIRSYSGASCPGAWGGREFVPMRTHLPNSSYGATQQMSTCCRIATLPVDVEHSRQVLISPMLYFFLLVHIPTAVDLNKYAVGLICAMRDDDWFTSSSRHLNWVVFLKMGCSGAYFETS